MYALKFNLIKSKQKMTHEIKHSLYLFRNSLLRSSKTTIILFDLISLLTGQFVHDQTCFLNDLTNCRLID